LPLLFSVRLMMNWRGSASASDWVLVFFLLLVMLVLVILMMFVVMLVMLVVMLVMFVVVLLMLVAVPVVMTLGMLMMGFLVVLLVILLVYWRRRWRQGLALVSIGLEPTIVVRSLFSFPLVHLTIYSNTVPLTLR
jgi:hypothetical protein